MMSDLASMMQVGSIARQVLGVVYISRTGFWGVLVYRFFINLGRLLSWEPVQGPLTSALLWLLTNTAYTDLVWINEGGMLRSSMASVITSIQYCIRGE